MELTKEELKNVAYGRVDRKYGYTGNRWICMNILAPLIILLIVYIPLAYISGKTYNQFSDYYKLDNGTSIELYSPFIKINGEDAILFYEFNDGSRVKIDGHDVSYNGDLLKETTSDNGWLYNVIRILFVISALAIFGRLLYLTVNKEEEGKKYYEKCLIEWAKNKPLPELG